MRFTSILPAVFATAIMAAPTAVEIRGDEVCAPVSYTISDFILQISPSTGTANFNMKSFFSVGNLEDEVQWGVHCRGAGSSVPNSNECKAEKRHLLFDLRGPQEQAYYQITHTWYCNGGTWMSGTAVKVEDLNCRNYGGTNICTGGPITFAPQNVRKICPTPTC